GGGRVGAQRVGVAGGAAPVGPDHRRMAQGDVQVVGLEPDDRAQKLLHLWGAVGSHVTSRRRTSGRPASPKRSSPVPPGNRRGINGAPRARRGDDRGSAVGGKVLGGRAGRVAVLTRIIPLPPARSIRPVRKKAKTTPPSSNYRKALLAAPPCQPSSCPGRGTRRVR